MWKNEEHLVRCLKMHTQWCWHCWDHFCCYSVVSQGSVCRIRLCRGARRWSVLQDHLVTDTGEKMQKVRHRWKGSCAEGWKLHLSSSASINQLLMSHFQLKNACIFSSVCPCMPQQSCHGRVCGAATLREPGGGVEGCSGGNGGVGRGEDFLQTCIQPFRCWKMVRSHQWYIWMWILNINMWISFSEYIKEECKSVFAFNWLWTNLAVM